MLAQIPIQIEVREAGDAGMPIVLRDSKHPAAEAFMELGRRIVAAMPPE
jgi:ATP-binding protein involved in chromosome partitioning